MKLGSLSTAGSASSKALGRFKESLQRRTLSRELSRAASGISNSDDTGIIRSSSIGGGGMISRSSSSGGGGGGGVTAADPLSDILLPRRSLDGMDALPEQSPVGQHPN